MIRNIFYIVWKQKKLVNETKHGLVNCCKYGSASGRVEKICRTGLESGSRVSCGTAFASVWKRIVPES